LRRSTSFASLLTTAKNGVRASKTFSPYPTLQLRIVHGRGDNLFNFIQLLCSWRSRLRRSC
jgi:hypothetical protein